MPGREVHRYIDYTGMCHCWGYGFQTIQSRTRRINHGNFCLEQGIEFCNIYKLFSAEYNNAFRMRIGLTEFWCTWFTSPINCRLILSLSLSKNTVESNTLLRHTRAHGVRVRPTLVNNWCCNYPIGLLKYKVHFVVLFDVIQTVKIKTAKWILMKYSTWWSQADRDLSMERKKFRILVHLNSDGTITATVAKESILLSVYGESRVSKGEWKIFWRDFVLPVWQLTISVSYLCIFL